MAHPLTRVAPERRKALFWVLFSLTILLMFSLSVLGKPLNTTPAPYGIVSFELAGQAQKSVQIIQSWDENTRILAGFNLGLDYLYMLAYSTTIALGCLWAAEMITRGGFPGSALGQPLAWGQWAAALFDMLENAFLLIILLNCTATPWSMLARGCALLKFALIFAGLVYSFLGLIARFIRR